MRFSTRWARRIVHTHSSSGTGMRWYLPFSDEFAVRYDHQSDGAGRVMSRAGCLEVEGDEIQMFLLFWFRSPLLCVGPAQGPSSETMQTTLPSLRTAL